MNNKSKKKIKKPDKESKKPDKESKKFIDLKKEYKDLQKVIKKEQKDFKKGIWMHSLNKNREDLDKLNKKIVKEQIKMHKKIKEWEKYNV